MVDGTVESGAESASTLRQVVDVQFTINFPELEGTISNGKKWMCSIVNLRIDCVHRIA